MSRVVLDASAVLALLLNETGEERVNEVIDQAQISSVNTCEVLTRLIDLGYTAERSTEAFDELSLTVTPFDSDHAIAASALRPVTRAKGLSLGDRACLALALREGLGVMTADRAWASIDLGITIELIR